MKPNRIILIRHGESEGNVDWDKYLTVPDHCLSLTKTGEKQALKAGEDISNIVGSESVYAYISPYDRTRKTFDQIKLAISENIVRSIEDPRIREQDWGHFKHPDVGEEITQARDAYSTFYYRIPDGESGADVYDRVSTFFETLHRDSGKSDFSNKCFVVTHGLILR